MAKNDKKEQVKVLDIKSARKTIFFDGELKRRKARVENKHCPYRIVRVWDAEKQKYVKQKVYRKKTTFTKTEMKERFNPVKGRDIVKTPKITATDLAKLTEKTVHAKSVQMQPKVTHHYIGIASRRRLDWDQEKLCYKAAA